MQHTCEKHRRRRRSSGSPPHPSFPHPMSIALIHVSFHSFIQFIQKRISERKTQHVVHNHHFIQTSRLPSFPFAPPLQASERAKTSTYPRQLTLPNTGPLNSCQNSPPLPTGRSRENRGVSSKGRGSGKAHAMHDTVLPHSIDSHLHRSDIIAMYLERNQYRVHVHVRMQGTSYMLPVCLSACLPVIRKNDSWWR
jgi:hypothetical protein